MKQRHLTPSEREAMESALRRSVKIVGQTEVERLRAENERLIAMLLDIVRAYDAYRSKGVMPAPDAYGALVTAIVKARSALEGEDGPAG